jgi:predicted transcriptional regulator
MADDITGNKQVHLDINTDIERIHTIAHALSSELRLEIIHILVNRSMNVNELAQALDVPLSTISMNLAVLEKVGLIGSESQAGVRGTMKLCIRLTDLMTVNLVAQEQRPHYVDQMTMPIGCFSEAGDIKPTCGLADHDGFIGVQDNPLAFYLPGRFGAQLIWMRQGYLEYRFPTMPMKGILLEAVEISFEACSEAINYRPEWPSDISLFINGVRVGSWLSAGDFGGRRGLLNPDWWSDSSTQFGHLVTWRIDNEGSFIDHMRASDVKLEQLGIQSGDHFTMRLGVEPTAPHVGGMNLFGRSFGDYQQDIVIRYAHH